MGKDWDNFSSKTKKDSTARRDANNRGPGGGNGNQPFSYSPDSGRTKKERDAFISFLTEVMTECLRVLKPGGHAFVWALPRTSHWTATAIEDAGFEIRDVITHLFGCLSEDTEILTSNGWEQYHKCVVNNLALCYNVNTQQFGWEPIQEVLTYDYNDTAYRLHSDHTDQLVSRNHRCIVEQDGSQVFQYAETLQSEESVPILEDLPALLEALPLPYERTGSTQSLLQAMYQSERKRQAQGQEQETASDLSYVQQSIQTKEQSFSEQGEILFSRMLRQMEINRPGNNSTFEGDSLQGQRGMDTQRARVSQAAYDRCQQSSMEGRRNLLQNARQLYGREVYPVSSGISGNGTQGRLHNGASAIRSSGSGAATLEKRSSTSQRPQSWEQRSEQSATVCEQFRPQTIRGSRYTSTDLATVTPVHYQGVVWCVRVPSGAFVARRNGKVFITGNSGFPKSLDVSKAIDRMRQDDPDIERIRYWLDQQRQKAGITLKQINQHFGHADNGGGSASSWMTNDTTKNLPAWEQWLELKSLLNFSDEMDAEVWRLNGRKGKPGDAWYERKVIGHSENWGKSGTVPVSAYGEYDITAPSTPEAQRYSGYGTALKPANEHWILARKPISEKSIAENVLRWNGCGALNIEQCRVSGSGGGWNGLGNTHRNAYSNQGWSPDGIQRSTQGRFPSNLLLSHSVWCIPIGTKRVRGTAPGGRPSNGKAKEDGHPFSFGIRHNISYNDPDGMEEVEAYECHESCPIAELDRQSGVRAPGYRKNPSTNKTTWFGATDGSHIEGERGYNDQGGASRYFSQFSPDVPIPFRYISKASRTERNTGCEGLPALDTRIVNNQNCKICRECGKHLPNSYSFCPCGGSLAITEVVNPPKANSHPTVKPLALCQWLIRLVTPPGGTVLDCFAGSGSTLVAAIHEGVHFIGIEQDEAYCAIAESRIAYAFKETKSVQAPHAEEYDCHPSCPIRILGEQSGERKSKWGKSKAPLKNSMFLGDKYGEDRRDQCNEWIGDQGTAARYFQQFAFDAFDEQEEGKE